MRLEDDLVDLIFLKLGQGICKGLIERWQNHINEVPECIFVAKKDFKGGLEYCMNWTATKLNKDVTVVGFFGSEWDIRVVHT